MLKKQASAFGDCEASESAPSCNLINRTHNTSQNTKNGLQSLLSRHQTEITSEVKSIASYYPKCVKIFIPKDSFLKRESGWEANSTPNKNKSQTNQAESSIERSIRRSRKKASDYIVCNSFDQFVTFTFACDRHDIDLSKTKLMTWLKNQRDRVGKFKYILVPEYHKDGALHFHGLFKNYKGELIRSRSLKSGRLLYSRGKAIYSLKNYTLGFTKIIPIDGNLGNIAGYLCKYITKEMTEIFQKKRYWISNGLKSPFVEYNPSWFQGVEPDQTIKNDYGSLLIYNDPDTSLLPEKIRLLREVYYD